MNTAQVLPTVSVPGRLRVRHSKEGPKEGLIWRPLRWHLFDAGDWHVSVYDDMGSYGNWKAVNREHGGKFYLLGDLVSFVDDLPGWKQQISDLYAMFGLKRPTVRQMTEISKSVRAYIHRSEPHYESSKKMDFFYCTNSIQQEAA